MRTRLSPPGGGQGLTSEFILPSSHACYGTDTPPLTNRCVHRGAPAQRIFQKVLARVIIWEWGTSWKADAKAWTSALQTNNYRNLWHNREPPWQLELTDSFGKLSSCATHKDARPSNLGLGSELRGPWFNSKHHKAFEQTNEAVIPAYEKKKCSVQVGQAHSSAQLGSQPLSISWHLASTLLGRWGRLDIPFLQGCQFDPHCPISV